jgi:cytochrome c oxidase subunit 4
VDDTASTTAVATVADAVGPRHPAETSPHPGPAQYVRVAAALAVVTALEVTVYYVDLPGKLLVAVLVGLATIKFSLVAAYFMHLKFDAHLLRRVFLTGIILACGVYAVGLFTMDLLFH